MVLTKNTSTFQWLKVLPSLFHSFVIFFVASSDSIARLWNVDAGEVVREYKGHQKAVVSLAFRDAQVS